MASQTYTFRHNGRVWLVAHLKGSYLIRDDQGEYVGPYSTAAEAEDWVRAIRP